MLFPSIFTKQKTKQQILFCFTNEYVSKVSFLEILSGLPHFWVHICKTDEIFYFYHKYKKNVILLT